MTKKPVSKFDSVKNDPLLQGKKGLEFDNISESESTELTPAQKATVFLSKYMDVIDPIDTYSDYFHTSAKGEAWELKDIKTQYVNLVVSEKWSEEKYVAVINDIFENRAIFSPLTLDIRGRMYEQGSLSSQQRLARNKRRGRL